MLLWATRAAPNESIFSRPQTGQQLHKQMPSNLKVHVFLTRSARYLPLNSCRKAWRLCTLWSFSAPAAPAKTLLFTAREPLWHSKWPLGPARVLLERSEGLFRACFGAASALEMAALACPGAASALKKAAQACFDAASALKIAILACSGATSALKKPV